MSGARVPGKVGGFASGSTALINCPNKGILIYSTFPLRLAGRLESCLKAPGGDRFRQVDARARSAGGGWPAGPLIKPTKSKMPTIISNWLSPP